MASSTAHLQPPPAMEIGAGPPATTWKKWRQRFEIFLTASGQHTATNDVKISLLLHAIGPDGIEVFNTLTFTADDKTDTDVCKYYEKVINKFHVYFVPKVNVTYERPPSCNGRRSNRRMSFLSDVGIAS